MTVEAIRAVLDTSVLYPPYLRDTLLLAAEQGVYEPIWSALILDELRRNVLEYGATPARVERTIVLMRRQFPRAEHAVARTAIEQMTNAPEDRHVAALAVATAASAIVTANLRDFPRASLAPYGIVAQSPDDFLVRLFNADVERIRRILADQVARYRTPAMSFDHLLDRLSVHAPTLVLRLRPRPAAPVGQDDP